MWAIRKGGRMVPELTRQTFGCDAPGGWRMAWKDWAFALILILLASVNATLYAEYRHTKSGVVLWGIVRTLLVVILLLLVRYLPF